jgi:hypothetical protein
MQTIYRQVQVHRPLEEKTTTLFRLVDLIDNSDLTKVKQSSKDFKHGNTIQFNIKSNA